MRYFDSLPTVGGRSSGQDRDNQRSRLYGTEGAWTGSSAAARRLLDNGPRVLSTGAVSIEACQAYVDDLLGRAWFQRRWGRRHREVRHKVSGAATGGHQSIALPPWARTEKVILHELAHTLTPGNRAWHGPEFAGVYLELVRYAVGPDAYKAQRAAFREKRVKVSRTDVPAASAHRVQRPVRRPAPVKPAPPTPAYLVAASRSAAAEVIRQAVRAGEYGPAGSVGRKAALATARRLAPPR